MCCSISSCVDTMIVFINRNWPWFTISQNLSSFVRCPHIFAKLIFYIQTSCGHKNLVFLQEFDSRNYASWSLFYSLNIVSLIEELFVWFWLAWICKNLLVFSYFVNLIVSLNWFSSLWVVHVSIHKICFKEYFIPYQRVLSILEYSHKSCRIIRKSIVLPISKKFCFFWNLSNLVPMNPLFKNNSLYLSISSISKHFPRVWIKFCKIDKFLHNTLIKIRIVSESRDNQFNISYFLHSLLFYLGIDPYFIIIWIEIYETYFGSSHEHLFENCKMHIICFVHIQSLSSWSFYFLGIITSNEFKNSFSICESHFLLVFFYHSSSKASIRENKAFIITNLVKITQNGSWKFSSILSSNGENSLKNPLIFSAFSSCEPLEKNLQDWIGLWRRTSSSIHYNSFLRFIISFESSCDFHIFFVYLVNISPRKESFFFVLK